MFTKVTNQAELNAVSLDEAKSQLNIVDDNSEDVHVQLLIDTATNLAQKYTNRLFSIGTVNLLVSNKLCMFLPYGEAESITSVQVTGDDISYEFEPITQELVITDHILSTDKVKVIYQAGYVDAPHEAKMGILMLISTLYEFRESFIDASISDIPLSATAVLDAIKIEDF